MRNAKSPAAEPERGDAADGEDSGEPEHPDFEVSLPPLARFQRLAAHIREAVQFFDRNSQRVRVVEIEIGDQDRRQQQKQAERG